MRLLHRHRPAVMRALLLIPLITAVLLGPRAHAIALSSSVEAIAGEDWAAEGISLVVASRHTAALSLTLTIDRLVLPDGQGVMSSLRFACADVVTGDEGWVCEHGRLEAVQSPVGAQAAEWSGHWSRDGRVKIEIPRLRVARGVVGATLDYGSHGWSLDLALHRLSVPSLNDLTGAQAVPRHWSLAGYLDGRVALTGRGIVEVALVADQLNYASPDGTQAGEDLVLRIDLSARVVGGEWHFDTVWRWPVGAVYSEPLFVDAGTTPLTVELTGVLMSDMAGLKVDSATASIEQAFSISGAGELSLDPMAVQEMTLAAHSDDAGRAFSLLLQPFLIGTVADDLAVEGQVGFVLHFDEAGIDQAGLTLNRLSITDRLGRVALHPSDGSVAWQRDGEGTLSSLVTEGVSLFAIRSGPFAADARFAGDRLTLVQPIVVPLLDGEVALDAFALSGALVEGARPAWAATASVRGVSLDRLTRELAWPPFTGSLAGELTDVRYSDRVLTVGGGLRVAAFDGEIRVDNLRIRDPLGVAPILTADAVMRGLDLLEVTKTFSVGRIEGRLDGDLSDLQLVAWQPDRFDLHLYTPPGDRTRRRISQRAVENLTELGSGIPAGLSASLLGLFEEFGYKAIDIKVALRGNAASIDGLARDDGGYYLVRGSGLPRIDVIGRNRRVAWKDLLERLQQIQVENATIE